ncbi:MAG: hypothetical protein OXT74_16730 [Candidatus Poribacteria bacterium]|nr:hypothetical protein [Candidatus Poribacteria bacterium]
MIKQFLDIPALLLIACGESEDGEAMHVDGFILKVEGETIKGANDDHEAYFQQHQGIKRSRIGKPLHLTMGVSSHTE